MQTDDNKIKLALDTVDLVILRWLINQAKRNVTVDPHAQPIGVQKLISRPSLKIRREWRSGRNDRPDR
jgi:hypothetical protein